MYGFYIGVLQGGEFFVCGVFVVGDDGVGVVYVFVWRGSYISDVGYYWFGYVGFDEGCGFFFGGIVDFVDYDDGFGLWIFLEQFQDVDEVGVWDWVVVDVYVGGLVEVGVGGLFYGFVGQGVGM